MRASWVVSHENQGGHMKVKVHFVDFGKYWVAEAENGAVSEGSSLDECRANIIDAISLLESENDPSSKPPVHRYVDELLEVAV